MSDHISYRRKTIGRYQVLYDGATVGEIRTTCHNHHWCWVIVNGQQDCHWRNRHFHSRDAAGTAAVSGRVA